MDNTDTSNKAEVEKIQFSTQRKTVSLKGEIFILLITILSNQRIVGSEGDVKIPYAVFCWLICVFPFLLCWLMEILFLSV